MDPMNHPMNLKDSTVSTDTTVSMNPGWRADTDGGCGPFPSLGEIQLLIVATATQNLALTGRRTTERRSRHAAGATAPRSL